MKPKFGLLALLVVFLLVPTLAHGALFTIADGKNEANKLHAGEYGVIGSFKLTDGATAGGSKVTAVLLDASVGEIAGNTVLNADTDSVSVWVDVNQNGKLERDLDTFVATSGAAFGNDAGGGITLTLTGDDQVALADGETKWFLVALLLKEVPAGAGEGGVIDVEVTVSDNASPVATVQINDTGAAWTDDTVDYIATHLTFKSTGYMDLTGSVGGEMANDGVILNAVDDWGNVDSDFVEKVQFLLYNYSTLEQIKQDFTATANAAGDDVKWGAAWTNAPAMVAGVLSANTGAGGAGAVKSLKYAPTTGIGGPVTLVARTQVKELEGSITITNDTA